MKPYSIDQLRFYDGRVNFIDKKRINTFETRAIFDRFYSGSTTDVNTVIESLGPTCLFYSNVQPWATEIPDIDSRSTRLFTIWGEDQNTNEIIVLLRGYYILPPFIMGSDTIKDYYFFSETSSYYPIVIISSFLTVLHDLQELGKLLRRTEVEIQKNWQELRQRVITSYEKTDLWKRYVLSFDKIVHFSYVCSSFDRELAEALREKNYQMTGALHVFASTTPSYDQAMVAAHIDEAKKILNEADKKKID